MNTAVCKLIRCGNTVDQFFEPVYAMHEARKFAAHELLWRLRTRFRGEVAFPGDTVISRLSDLVETYRV